MVTHEIRFDPTSPQEAYRVIEYFIQHYSDEVERALSRVRGVRTTQGDSTFSQQQFLKKIADLQEQVRILEGQKKSLEGKVTDMNSDLERYQKAVSKHDGKVAEKDAEISKLNERIEKLQKDLQEAEQYAKMSADDAEEKLAKERAIHESEIEKKNAELRQSERERINETRKLEKELERLKTKLQEFVPNIGGNLGEEQYYQLDEFAQTPTLTQTVDNAAPYIVVSSDNGQAMFHFNTEKGPAAKAIANRDDMLTPFCEIVDEMDNANSIQPAGEGIATISSMGDLRSSDVKTKAKIRLIRI